MEFDDLLKEVLWDEGNVELPPGMETRIAAALAASPRRSFILHKPRYFAAAAAMLAVVAGAVWGIHSTFGTPSRAVTPASPLTGRSLADGISEGPGKPLSALPRRNTGPHKLPVDCRSWEAQTREARVVSLESIVISPIEIAALKFDSTNQGETR